MRSVPAKVIEKLENLPERPGVYIFKDRFGRPIYIGKAKVLRNRVRSYFQESRRGEVKLERLLSRVADIDLILTDSEVEALVLEANLIKEYKPRYNINLKDDKSYPYVRVTNEPYPRIFATRRVVKDGSRYFGPFTDVGALRDLLRMVHKVFPIRSCKLALNEEAIAQGKFKVCLDYHIGRCLGPCEAHVSRESYLEMVGYAVDFIEGRDQRVIRQLQERMKALAQELRFEEAARLRDVLKAVEAFRDRQKVVSTEEVDRDIVTGAADLTDACAVVFKIREGRIVGRQDFQLQRRLDEDLPTILEAFLKLYYLKSDFIPSEIVLPCAVPEVAQLEGWLRTKAGSDVRLRQPDGEEELKLMAMCTRNAELLLEEIKLQRLRSEEYVNRSVEALRRDLKLSRPPKRIEAFDVSNIQGKYATASEVCFINGRPAKSQYRRFRIRVKETPDDFAMMREVVERHYRRSLAEGRELPDLILIDGGRGQISAALDSLNRLGLKEIPVIGLAKRLDEIYRPEFPDPQNLPKDSPSLRLLQRIRDEAHRFAVEYHRRLRSREALVSRLEGIEGIGKRRAQALLEAFGSLRRIAQASVEELAEVDGMTQSAAITVWKHFHPSNEEAAALAGSSSDNGNADTQ
ncbi:MAG: excinuclease ABC subunit UvrC [candidate division KSB1 bacterium]|nr:excinuclease ABC subunit UvrC [candidate division KSB1 bacterium]